MKKLLPILICTFFSIPCYAGTIQTIDDFSADSNVSHFNQFKNAILDEFNGSIESANIAADAITESNMADDANPRIRTNELLGVGIDSTTSQTAVVYSGLTPATDSDLTSDISAGVAYINGYRVSKSATSNTYTASKDTYVDLDVNGNFTFSEVANGAATPSVAANSARLAKVVTDADNITSVTDLANRRIPGLIIPSEYRSGMEIQYKTTTAIDVTYGSIEVNNAIVDVTSSTTLDLTVDGDWATGSSEQATATYGFVGIDSSGNLKLDDTAPTNSNYDLTSTVGLLRYVSWNSTTYRVIGWFYMNATGSGQLDLWGVSNVPEMGIANAVQRVDSNSDTINDTSFGSDMTGTTINFYSFGQPFLVNLGINSEDASNGLTIIIDIDGTDKTQSIRGTQATGSGLDDGVQSCWLEMGLAQGGHTIKGQAKVASADDPVDEKCINVIEW